MSTDIEKLVKLLNLVSSDADGESLNASRLAAKLAGKLGGWSKLLTTQKPERDTRQEAFQQGYTKGYQDGLRRNRTQKPRTNMVYRRESIIKLIEKFHEVWDHLDTHHKMVVSEYIRYYELNRALTLHQYDTLRQILNFYW